jgi:hypothetical protein
MNDLIEAIERVGFPIAVIVFGCYYFLLPLRDAGLRFISTLESFLSKVGEDVHALKSSTSMIIKNFEITQAVTKDTNEKIKHLTENHSSEK